MAGFRLVPEPTFRASVAVPGPQGRAVLEVVFRFRGQKELREWLERSKEMGDVAFLGELIADWSGVEDAGGAPVAYSADAIAALLDGYPAAGGEILDAYMRALRGEREKN